MAAPSQLLHLDKARRWYLRQLGLTDSEAFTKFNFAPPSIRRAIGMLGFLHKRTLGLCHSCLRDALPVAVGLDADYHSKALDPFSGEVIFQRRLYERSLYAYILMYNRLPQATVDLPTVSAFQAQLTHMAKNRVTLDPENWRSSFQSLADVVRMLYG